MYFARVYSSVGNGWCAPARRCGSGQTIATPVNTPSSGLRLLVRWSSASRVGWRFQVRYLQLAAAMVILEDGAPTCAWSSSAACVSNPGDWCSKRVRPAVCGFPAVSKIAAVAKCLCFGPNPGEFSPLLGRCQLFTWSSERSNWSRRGHGKVML